MSSGERPIGAAKGKQPNTEALCQTPPTGVPATPFDHRPPTPEPETRPSSTQGTGWRAPAHCRRTSSRNGQPLGGARWGTLGDKHRGMGALLGTAHNETQTAEPSWGNAGLVKGAAGDRLGPGGARNQTTWGPGTPGPRVTQAAHLCGQCPQNPSAPGLAACGACWQRKGSRGGSSRGQACR